MSAGIRVRALRLLGAGRDYEVDFTRQGHVRALSVVAGPAMTGKTSVLEFIDYCLGADRHPSYPEVERKVTAALVELEIADRAVVLERRLFTDRNVVLVHHAPLSQLAATHSIERREIGSPTDEHSLAAFLLSAIGLEGVTLKTAPTQEASETEPLSFRNIMWLAFLPYERIGTRNLLFESTPPRHNKVAQVIDVVFGVHDPDLIELNQRLATVQARLTDERRQAQAVRRFLDDEEVGSRDDVRDRRNTLEGQVDLVNRRIADVDVNRQAQTGFTDELRTRYRKAIEMVRDFSARLRERETLLERLRPLRGQYAEDATKLRFFEEARQLFDPLRVSVCPACQNTLPEQVGIRDGHCSLCGQGVLFDRADLDVDREIRAAQTRLRELDGYIGNVEAQAADVRSQLDELRREEAVLQRELDAVANVQISAYVAQRDALLREREILQRQLNRLEEQERLLAGHERRLVEISRLEETAARLRERIAIREAERPTRDDLVRDLSDRFRRLLDEFRYPKLEEAFVDDRYTPHVRRMTYSDVSSGGALTLLALAWQLALFEQAVESGADHPRFLLIDSPQKGFGLGEHPDPEFTDPLILRSVYAHLNEWAAGPGADAQIIVVDNTPPTEADDVVVVRYTRDSQRPPYGLIEDETS
jgi:hypothetical protein